MGNFGEIGLSYKERFVILFALNNMPSHDMKTATLWRDIKEVLRFDEITMFDAEPIDDPVPDPVISFEDAPQFLEIIPALLPAFFKRFGFPPPVAQEALSLIDRLDQMIALSVPDNLPVAPGSPESVVVDPDSIQTQ